MKTETILIQKFSVSKETIKPKLFALTYYSIAVVLLVSGFSKILNPENFLNTLNTTLNLLNENIIILFATILPILEVTLGLLLLLSIKVKETLIVTVILFAAFFLYAIFGTIKGFDVDCGCFGSSVSSEFGVGMIARNLVLLVIVIVLNKNEKMIFIKDQNK